MKTASIASLTSGKTTARNKRKSKAERPRTRALRIESLESRDLLSVATGSEFLASDGANIRGFISDGFTVDEAIAAYGSNAATHADEILDITENMIDDAAFPRVVPQQTELEQTAPDPTVADGNQSQSDSDPPLDNAASAPVSGPGIPSIYYDADKSIVNTEDDNLCWAATASNMLWHTDWASVTNAQNEQEFFNEYFVNTWLDAGAPIENGVSWFLNDEFYYGSSTTTNASAGYY